MNNPIASAAALINHYSPFLAQMFVSRPFHRRTVITTLFEKLKADGNEDAYRIRVILFRALEA